MRILVECSYVFNHPHIKSGIQRVVRNIVSHLGDVDSPAELMAVSFRKDKLIKVNTVEASAGDKVVAPVRLLLEGLHRRYWAIYHSVKDRPLFRGSKILRAVLCLLMILASLPFFIPLRLLTLITELALDSRRSEVFEVRSDDVLVLLDSSWNEQFFGPIEAIKARGVKIVSVVYDLIPITHPHFYDHKMTALFQKWLDWSAGVADGYMAISNTVKDQVTDYVGTHAPGNTCWYDSFYLGSELDGIEYARSVSETLQNLYQGSRPVYLTVSTIEPRKNHAYQLDAFELFWAQGGDASLCIVGKVGWKCGALVERIRRHPEYNKRLFMFNRMDDAELVFAYQHAKALLFTSFVEGFGLPIVEASQRGLRVICSDIPIFREIGGAACAYCDLTEPGSLAGLILAFEESGHFPGGEGRVTWQSWGQSTNDFIEKIVKHTA